MLVGRSPPRRRVRRCGVTRHRGPHSEWRDHVGSIPTASLSPRGGARLLLKDPSFGNAALIAEAIDRQLGRGTAYAVSPAVVAVHQRRAGNSVAFMANVLAVDVTPEAPPPTVVVDAQSDTIVMGGAVRLRPAIVSHGNLTVSIQANTAVSQPNPLSRGQTAAVTNANVNAQQGGGHVVALPGATTLSAIADALNKIGATPADLIAIVQALKEAGALDAEVKVL